MSDVKSMIEAGKDVYKRQEFIPVIEAEGLSHKGTIKPVDMTINKGCLLYTSIS